MDRLNNIDILGEKLTYLIQNSLRERNFKVYDVDIDINTHGEMIEHYFVNLDVDYQPPVSSVDIGDITHEFDKILSLITESVSEFTPTTQGKLIKDNKSIFINARVYSVEFTEDEIQRFLISYFIEPKKS